MMKKIIAVILAALMLLTVVGCGGGAGSQTEKKYVVLEDKLAAEEYGIGFRKDDIALGMAVYGALDEMIDDGTAAEISKKWFGENILVKNDTYIEDTTAPGGDQSLQKVKDAGKLVLGLDASFPPMGFTDENNEIVGFDIDLAEEVCKRLGVTLVKQPIDWDSKEMELDGGKIDCIWNGMTITDARVEAMFIPKAYVANAQIVIVPEGSDIQTVAALEGKKVGLQKGSSALEALQGNAVYEKVGEVIEYEDNVTCYLDLKAGRVDAMVVDEIVGRYLIETE